MSPVLFGWFTLPELYHLGIWLGGWILVILSLVYYLPKWENWVKK